MPETLPLPLLLSDVVSHGATLPTTIHPLVEAGLCVSDAWRAGEMEELLIGSGYRIEARWHRSSTIVSLIERVTERARVLGMVARYLGLDVGGLIAPFDPGFGTSPTGPADLRAAADAVIEEVQSGRLRYLPMAAIRADAVA